MKSIQDRGAQGDVFFRRIAAVPAGSTVVKPENGSLIVTHSETGHHHAVLDLTCVMYQDPKSAR